MQYPLYSSIGAFSAHNLYNHSLKKWRVNPARVSVNGTSAGVSCTLLDTLAPLCIPLNVWVAVAAAGEDEAAAAAPHVREETLGLLHVCVYLRTEQAGD